MFAIERYDETRADEVKKLSVKAEQVNCRNTQAYKSYQKCGFQDTGELYLGGPVGPQHIMKQTLY